MSLHLAALLGAMILTVAGCRSGATTTETSASSSRSTAATMAGTPGATSQPSEGRNSSAAAVETTATSAPSNATPDGTTVAGAEADTAYFAGGCFWCMEASLEHVPGVVAVISGYTGGTKKNPTYEEVGSGSTGHAESVQVIFDPTRISYARLLNAFWHNVDPLAAGRQFCDVGSQYRSAIFYRNDQQRRLAEESKRSLEESGRLDKPVVTGIVPASKFYRAEDYHQDYYKKNPADYQAYRSGCGRDRRLKELWGDLAGTAD